MLDSILNFVGKGLDMWNSSNQTDKRIEADRKLQEQNIANQKEFAQQGIRWKVADAQAAGLHPLAALGAQTSSFSNVVGGDIPIAKSDFGGMGQDIGRAIDAGSTQTERSDRMGSAIARTAQVFSLEKMNLENELLKSQVAKSNAQLGPALPGSALAHLSRSPTRTMSGSVIDDKKSEQEQETPQPTKTLRWYGVPLETPTWHSSGQTFDDVLGDDMSAKLFNIPPLVLHNLYRAYQEHGKKSPLSKGKSPPRMFPYFR